MGQYQNSKLKAEDNKSSAWILIGFGLVGIIVIILGIMGVIPLNIGNAYLFYGVMSAIFILFIVMGFVSMKNAKVFEKKAVSEHSLEEKLLSFVKQNLKGEEIDLQIDSELPAEELYFARVSYITDLLNDKFVGLDPDFLDNFIDEKVYDILFGAKEA